MKNKNFLAMLAFLAIFAATPAAIADDNDSNADTTTTDTSNNDSEPSNEDDTTADASSNTPAASSDTDGDTDDTAAPTETVQDVKAAYSAGRMALKRKAAQELVANGLADNEKAAMRMLNEKHKKVTDETSAG